MSQPQPTLLGLVMRSQTFFDFLSSNVGPTSSGFVNDQKENPNQFPDNGPHYEQLKLCTVKVAVFSVKYAWDLIYHESGQYGSSRRKQQTWVVAQYDLEESVVFIFSVLFSKSVTIFLTKIANVSIYTLRYSMRGYKFKV
ncbi:hypothetical protein RJ639_017936 [Escallonia herrerae]|uniref:Uncharacterized protein n=1 Tax=Escallonia herrerae TaxID=1293975 RepID=A0AA88VBT9_9ASTE|nr:hypothetical protein RJ639_017936 [Escallonia herrerae]